MFSPSSSDEPEAHHPHPHASVSSFFKMNNNEQFESISSPENCDVVDHRSVDVDDDHHDGVDIVDRLLFDLYAFTGSDHHPSSTSTIGIVTTAACREEYSHSSVDARSKNVGSCSLDSAINESGKIASSSNSVTSFTRETHLQLNSELSNRSTGEFYCFIDNSSVADSDSAYHITLSCLSLPVVCSFTVQQLLDSVTKSASRTAIREWSSGWLNSHNDCM